ncbi:MAG: hypothetical protein WC748_08220 [Legionellales bacterium]|jgi:hypothetical protein
MEILKILAQKVELQSILVLLITLGFGYLLVSLDTKLESAVGVLGCLSIAVGLLYTVISFFSIQIKESYKDVILEYRNALAAAHSSHKVIQDSYAKTLASDHGETRNNSSGSSIGEAYRPSNDTSSRTLGT